eukprot:10567905-Lingulodinium_polyedra.AAC.1
MAGCWGPMGCCGSRSCSHRRPCSRDPSKASCPRWMRATAQDQPIGTTLARSCTSVSSKAPGKASRTNCGRYLA